jgi:hypothetical protein
VFCAAAVIFSKIFKSIIQKGEFAKGVLMFNDPDKFKVLKAGYNALINL